MKTSENVKDIYAAFVKFQAEVGQPTKNAVNPFFKSRYTTLDEIIRTVQPVLGKHGLAIIQQVSSDGVSVSVVTRMIHETGQWIEAEPMTLKGDKATPQGLGSATSYARRYALSSILGIASEDDDDANSIEGQSVAKSENRGYKKTNYTVTEKQINRLYAIAASKKIDNKTVDAAIVKQLNKKAKDLTKKEYDMVCKAYEEMDIEKEPDTQHERSENDYSNEFNDSEELPF